MTKKSFLIHVDSLSVLNLLNRDQIAELFLAIKAFHENTKIHLSPVVEVAFFAFKSQFERDNSKYTQSAERNSANGKKGGRPNKKPKKASGLIGLSEKPTTTEGFFKKPKKADNDSDNGNDNVSENVNKNKEVLGTASPSASVSVSEIPNPSQTNSRPEGIAGGAAVEHPFQVFIRGLPNVGALRYQLTAKEAETLEDSFRKETVFQVLEQMENRKTLTKDYQSVFLTCKNWCLRRKQDEIKLRSETTTTLSKPLRQA